MSSAGEHRAERGAEPVDNTAGEHRAERGAEPVNIWPVSEENWQRLHDAAGAAMARAYAPYSKFPVGAAALVDDGRLVSGCNVENASYGLGLCAECGLVSNLIASGGGRLVAFACVDGAGAALMPCGRCRQLLYEHGGADLAVMAIEGPTTLGALLPQAFGPDDLATAASA